MKKQRYAFAFIIAMIMSVSIQAGTISGSLLDPNGNPNGAVQIFNSNGDHQGDFWPDGSGNWQTHDLPIGNYFAITKYSSGVIDQRWDGVNGSPCLNGLCDVLQGTPIVITLGVNITGINIVLDAITSGGTISGHAQDAGNAPLVNLTIAIFNSNGNYIRELRTDPLGNYDFGLMADDTYYVRTHNNEPLGMSRQAYNGYNCLPVYSCNDAALATNATAIVVAGSDVANIDFNLSVPATGSIILGNVVDEGINKPMPKTRMILINGVGNWLADTETDALGNYYFSGLADGDYKVYVERPPEGYSGELYNNIPCPNWSCNMATQGTIITIAGMDVPSINIGLSHTGTRLFGTVTRSDTSQPVSGEYRHFAVQVYDSSGNYMFESTTNDAGQYQLNLQTAGDYYLVTAQDQGYHGLYNEGWNNIQCINNCGDPIGMGATLIAVAAGTTVVRDFILDPTPFISGTVTAQNGGALLADIEVCVTRRDGNWIGCTRTDINGNYKMSGLPAETDLIPFVNSTANQPYQLETYINQAPYDWINGTGIDVSTTSATGIDFALEDGFFISGTVLEAGTGSPVIGVDICIHRTNGTYVLCRASEAGGVFQMPAFPAGTDYVAYVVGEQQGYRRQMWNTMNCPFGNCDFSQGTPISIGPGQATGIDFNLSPELGISIQGRITDSVTNNPIQSVQLDLQDSSGNYLTSVQSDVNGNYSFTLENDGDYIVFIPPHGAPNPYLPEVWPNVYCHLNVCSPSANGTVINVNGSNVTGIDFALESGNTISGTVLDGASNPVVGLAVCIHRLDGSFTGSCGDTDASGNYQTYQLPAGSDYVAYTVSESFGLIRQMWNAVVCPNNNCNFSQGTAITLGPANATAVDFNLYPGGSISGTVSDINGVLANVTVTLTNASMSINQEVVTDGAGVYSFDGLLIDDYYLMVTADAYFNQIYPNIDCTINCAPTAFGSAINIPTGISNIANVDFLLNAGARISGQVIDAANSMPIQGVSVQFYLPNKVLIKQTITDVNGNYLIGGLLKSAYYIETRSDFDMHLDEWYGGDVCQLQDICIPNNSGTPVVLASDTDSISSINFSLGIGGAITGQILLEDGTQFNNAWGALRAEIWDENKNLFTYDRIEHWNGETSYEILGLAPGTYYVVFNSTTKYTSWSQYTNRVDQALVDTAYGGLPCPRGSCDLSLTVPVTVSAGQTVTGIDGMLPWGPIMKGTLSDELTGNPIDGLVFIHDEQGNYASFGNENGVVGEWESFTALPSGTYYVSTYSKRSNFGLYNFTGLNFVDETYNNYECAGGCDMTLGTPITMASVVVTGIDMQLVSGGTLAGNVSDASGAVPFVSVLIYDSTGKKVSQVITDALGNYIFHALPIGSYYLRTDNYAGLIDEVYTSLGNTNCDPFCNPLIGDALTVASVGQAITGIDFVLGVAGEISGTVLDVSSSVIGGVQVETYDAIGNFVGSTLSDATGAFVQTNLAAGDYYIRTRNSVGLVDVLYQGLSCIGSACNATDGTVITVSSGATNPIGNLQLQAQLSIAGNLSDDITSVPISGAKVAVYDASGGFIDEVLTDTNGNYLLEGLLAGDYYIATRGVPGYVNEAYDNIVCPSSCAASIGAVITLSTTSLLNVDFSLSHGSEISGTVADVSAAGLVGVRVQIYDASGVAYAQGLTDINGNYTVAQIPNGNYYVRTSNNSGFVDQLYDSNSCEGFCDITSGTAIVVNSAPVVLDFSLLAGGSISGQISDGTNVIASIPVHIFDVNENLVGTTLTDAMGNYSVSGLLDGNYKVRTQTNNGYVNEFYPNLSCSPQACNFADAGTIHVNGVVNGIDFILSQGQSIAGTATDIFNNPLPSGTAVLYSSAAVPSPIMETPIVQGLWQFNGVSLGNYYLLIKNESGLIDKLYNGIACPGGACDITNGTLISLVLRKSATAVTNLNIVLNRGVKIGGNVNENSANPNPVEGASIIIKDMNGEIVASGSSDALGDYLSSSSLPPGDYLVYTRIDIRTGNNASLINELYDNIPCSIECDLSLGQTITINANDPDKQVLVTLESGGSMSGVAFDANGSLLVGSEIEFFNAAGFLSGTALVGFDGFYLVPALPAGSYYGIIRRSDGLGDYLYGGEYCGSGCNILNGPEVVVSQGQDVLNIDFTNFIDNVFKSGFEN